MGDTVFVQTSSPLPKPSPYLRSRNPREINWELNNYSWYSEVNWSILLLQWGWLLKEPLVVHRVVFGVARKQHPLWSRRWRSSAHGMPPVLRCWPRPWNILQSSRPLLWHMAASCRSPPGPRVHPHEVVLDTSSLHTRLNSPMRQSQMALVTQPCSALHCNCKQSF